MNHPVNANPSKQTNPTNKQTSRWTGAKLALLSTLVFLFTACSSVPETPELESAGATKYLKVRVASDSDDAEERSSGKVVTSSTDLELTYDVLRGQQLVGVRFRSLNIPQGARIKRAEVRFTADETDRGSLKLSLRGDDSDSAARFEATSRNLSKRNLTSATVTWEPRDWRVVGESGGKQFTNVTPILQEVVSRKGWQQGNAFALLISSQSKNAKRVAESYRGNKNAAPQLYVEYTLSTTSAGPTAPAPTPEVTTPTPTTKSALYIAPNGSDDNDGRSKSKPLKTFRKAAQLVRPGDTLYLRGGVYRGKYQSYFGSSEAPFSTSGRKDARITIMSYPGERAIIDGSDRSYKSSKSVSSPTLFKIKANYYTVQNITFRNSAGRGLYLKGSHFTVRNVLSHNHHSDGVYLLGDDSLFEDSVSHGNYSIQNGGDSADGIKISYGTRNTVRNFLAYNNSDDGIDIFCSTSTLVEYSVAHSNGRGSSGNGNGYKLGCRTEANNRNIARYNVAYKNRKNNFDSNSGGGLTMLHNTSWKAGGHGFVAYAPKSQGLTPITTKNNISYQDKKVRGMSSDDKARSRFNSWDLNITNPQFISLDPNSSNFLKLSSSSPAVDAGTKLSFSYEGSAPDLGALERGQSIAQLLGSKVQALQGGSLQLAGF